MDPVPNRFDEPMTPLQILFGFRGRIPRKAFWLYGVLLLLGAAVLLGLVLGLAGVRSKTLELAINLALLWPGIAVSVKRWHDRDKSGWWVLIGLIPVVGWIWSLVENGFLRGTAGDNRFGADLTERF